MGQCSAVKGKTRKVDYNGSSKNGMASQELRWIGRLGLCLNRKAKGLISRGISRDNLSQ